MFIVDDRCLIKQTKNRELISERTRDKNRKERKRERIKKRLKAKSPKGTSENARSAPDARDVTRPRARARARGMKE